MSKKEHEDISLGFQQSSAGKKEKTERRKLWTFSQSPYTNKHSAILKYSEIMTHYEITKSVMIVLNYIFEKWQNDEEVYKSNRELSKFLELSVRNIAYVKKFLISKEICKISYSKNRKSVLQFTDKFIKKYIAFET